MAKRVPTPAKTRTLRRSSPVPPPAAAAPAEPPVLNIFISHKSKDEAAAKELKRLLDAHCRKIKAFLSCDLKCLPGGTDWREGIHRALNEANWLILIYTTPGDNWDWCLYEAGYFAGRVNAAKADDAPPDPNAMGAANSLLVLHPPHVQSTPPLSAWQSVVAEPRRLVEHFNSIFRVGDPLCHFKGDHAQMEDLASKICNAIAPLRETLHHPNESMV